MCGIVGSLNVRWKNDPLKSLIHRGPDFQNSIQLDNLYLGHTRLSIQDMSSAGNQPMESSNGRYLIVFNGEIYNHWEIRKRLEKKGYLFNSTSDTETLLNGWCEWGKESINYLNGIFSFSIFDKKQKKIFIVRDQFGVKPLYVYHKNDKIAFSSEIKALLNIEDFDSSINLKSVVNYLTFLWSPGHQTMYKNVQKLLPGELLEIETKTLRVEKIIYKNKAIFNGEYLNLSEKEWVEKIDDQLNQSIEKQLLSDVPIGFFLSGGLDSSLIVAIAKSQKPNNQLNCFTIDQYKESKSDGFTDDLPYAKKVAKYCDISLNIIDSRSNWIDSFDKMIWNLDEPQADLAPINLMAISHFAKNLGIKVLIGGTGGDDIFSGYRRHQAMVFNSHLKKIPDSFLKIFSFIIQNIPFSNVNIKRLKKLSRDWGEDNLTQFMGYFNWLPSNHFIYDLFSKNAKKEVLDYDPYIYGKSLLIKNTNLSDIDQMLLLEQNTFLVDHNLNYTDKLSMSEGVESRVPFLDPDLVKLAGQIPQKFKIKNQVPKYILKKVAEKYLPRDVIYRSKTGFGAPVNQLIKNQFKPIIEKELNKDKLKNDGIFNPQKIEQIISNNSGKKNDFNYTILSLLAMQSWLKQFPWSFKT